MALVRPKSGERVPSVPTVPMDLAQHPTLSEIAQRQKDIESWDALNAGGYRFAKPGTIVGLLISAMTVLLALTPIPPNWPWNVPLLILAIFTTVGTVVCGLLWFDNPDIGPRPEVLTIVPFTRAENLHLMNGQAVESYWATCTCPGCGDLSTHLVRKRSADEPAWATVIRHCGVCGREWAQS
jgi:hypothetical protein